jgi:hypothetical protein
MPVLPTEETGSGSWPTPIATDGEKCPSASLSRAVNPSLKASYRNRQEGMMWPTVRSTDGERGGRGDLIQAVRGNENSHFKMWPTPRANESTESRETQLAREARGTKASKNLTAEVGGGSLNPTWVEWLMGWPLGWTDCAVSAMDRFRQWCGSHMGSCPGDSVQGLDGSVQGLDEREAA